MVCRLRLYVAWSTNLIKLLCNRWTWNVLVYSLDGANGGLSHSRWWHKSRWKRIYCWLFGSSNGRIQHGTSKNAFIYFEKSPMLMSYTPFNQIMSTAVNYFAECWPQEVKCFLCSHIGCSHMTTDVVECSRLYQRNRTTTGACQSPTASHSAVVVSSSASLCLCVSFGLVALKYNLAPW